MAVFGFVMSKLPERVTVYPTENYYYFGFMHDGIRYAGNIRLDASNRDEGKVIFAYTAMSPAGHPFLRLREEMDVARGPMRGIARSLHLARETRTYVRRRVLPARKRKLAPPPPRGYGV